MSKVAIIGGGASGIVAAIFAAKNNDVTVFCEQTFGKKLLVTGNGRCNLTNTKNFDKVYNQDINEYLEKFNYLDTIEFFNNLGLEIYVDEEGRVYPISNSAQSVVDVLLHKAQILNIHIKDHTKVESVKYGEKIQVITQDDIFNFDKVVISTGSTTQFLDDLHIEYKEFRPSLCALVTKQNTKRLSGLRLSNVLCKLEKDNKEYFEFGEVLFKDKGLSGICIFNLSSYLARSKNYNGKIFIDLLPKQTAEQTLQILTNRHKLNLGNAIDFMTGLFCREVNKYILSVCGISEDKVLTSNDIQKICATIKNLEFDIVDKYDNNQVKSGGINLEDLTQNFEHKKLKNIYFVGEVCDVDGLCGGYNLQWAFTSGKIAGESL